MGYKHAASISEKLLCIEWYPDSKELEIEGVYLCMQGAYWESC